MEKTSREYAEKLAKEYCQHDVENFDSQTLYVGKSKEEIYIDGYMKAVEETNVKGLLEVLKRMCKLLEFTSLAQKDTFRFTYYEAINEINKSIT